MASDLETEVARFAKRSRKATEEAAFRASVEERLRGLDEQVGEIKTRLNGLLFFLTATVTAQVLMRVLA